MSPKAAEAGSLELRGGSGLCGLADRVEALGGHLTVTGPPGDGTTPTSEPPSRTGASRTRAGSGRAALARSRLCWRKLDPGRFRALFKATDAAGNARGRARPGSPSLGVDVRRGHVDIPPAGGYVQIRVIGHLGKAIVSEPLAQLSRVGRATERLAAPRGRLSRALGSAPVIAVVLSLVSAPALGGLPAAALGSTPPTGAAAAPPQPDPAPTGPALPPDPDPVPGTAPPSPTPPRPRSPALRPRSPALRPPEASPPPHRPLTRPPAPSPRRLRPSPRRLPPAAHRLRSPMRGPRRVPVQRDAGVSRGSGPRRASRRRPRGRRRLRRRSLPKRALSYASDHSCRARNRATNRTRGCFCSPPESCSPWCWRAARCSRWRRG